MSLICGRAVQILGVSEDDNGSDDNGFDDRSK